MHARPCAVMQKLGCWTDGDQGVVAAYVCSAAAVFDLDDDGGGRRVVNPQALVNHL